MDVEKLKKINKLSVEFKKHGMADSANEAINKASESIRDPELREVLKKTAADSDAKASPAFEKQYQVMLERQNRQIAQELVTLKETVAAMQEEIKQLKSGSIRTASASPAQPNQEKQATLPKKESHPKQGKYTSDDVSVDKIFYYGNK